MKFESIADNHERAKVPGGWIVKAYSSVYHQANSICGGGEGWDWRIAMCFVPDPKHEWVIEKVEEEII